MEKTNKEIRSDLANKYHDKLKQVNETLDFLSNSWYSKKEIKAIRERLISNLESKLWKEEWYDESKKSHRAEHKAELSLNKAKEEKERLKKEYEKKIAEADKDIVEKSKTYKEAQIDYRWEVGEEIEVKDINKKLYWNKEKILENLKEKCVKVEENVEYMWYNWKKVHIDLPEIEWKFGWFKFEYFVSNESVLKRDFERNAELEKKSNSMKDVWGLLWAMNKYMQAMGVETDWDMDYKYDLKYWKTNNYRCDAWDCLKQITWLDYRYWLMDKNVDSKKNSRAAWYCNDGNCSFNRIDNDNFNANLFLRLS